MKRNFLKRLISMVIATSIVSTSSMITSATNIDSLEDEACNKFEKLINSFSTSTYSLDNEVVIYPDNYCGAFYSDGDLNICLTEISNNSTELYTEILGNENVNYIKSEYSYNYLMSLNEYLVNSMSANNIFNINTVSLLQKYNVINVTVSDEESAVALTSNILSQDFSEDAFNIVIDAAKPTPTSIYARPGDRVYKWNSNSSRGSHIATIGFNAQNSDGIKGFVTAEHALWNASNLGIYECNCSAKSSCATSKSTDSCFVPFSSSIAGCTGLISNSGLYGSNTYKITASYTSSANLEGQTLTGFGKTSGKYTGIVISTNTSYHLDGGDGTSITDALLLKTAKGKPAGGDSGGCIVKIQNSSTTPQTVTFAGILSATSDDTDCTYAYVPKAHKITSALGVTLISGSN